jgi:hypothetical protein
MRISRYIWSLITVILILALSTTAILWFVSLGKAISTQTGILRQQRSTTQNNNTAELAKGINIGLVEPTFTYAAYHNAFYMFYEKNLHTPNGYNITSNLNLLSKRVVNHNLGLTTPTSAFAMLNVLRNFKWLASIDNNVTVLTDAGVDNGSIFEKHIYNRSYEGGTGGSVILGNTYDVLILGHQEYVTQQEYNNLKQFVSNGGTLILLDGNVFYAEVKYDQKTETITLVKGHGWAYNGKTAWRSVGERWTNETSKWIGSNYFPLSWPVSFANDPFEYKHHEEQYVTNPNDTILTNYEAKSLAKQAGAFKPVIATYELHYKNGRVIVLGLYTDDIIHNKRFNEYFRSLILQYASD